MSGHDSASFNQGVRASIEWLHARAREMNDPHAKAILNTAAFHLGTEKPTGALRSVRVIQERGDGK